MASVTLDTTRRWLQFRSAGRTGRNACFPAIYVDGALARKGWVSLGGAPPLDLPTLDDLVSPEDIEAMEVYETQVPVRFGGGGGCGVVVIWRKDGRGL
jgi:hypothetical protein